MALKNASSACSAPNSLEQRKRQKKKEDEEKAKQKNRLICGLHSKFNYNHQSVLITLWHEIEI